MNLKLISLRFKLISLSSVSHQSQSAIDKVHLETPPLFQTHLNCTAVQTNFIAVIKVANTWSTCLCKHVFRVNKAEYKLYIQAKYIDHGNPPPTLIEWRLGNPTTLRMHSKQLRSYGPPEALTLQREAVSLQG